MKKSRPALGFYFVRPMAHGIRSITYLRTVGVHKGRCDVCMKKRITTAHHLIPGRTKCANKRLGALRIRVCDECLEKVHPENGLASDGILHHQNIQLVNLTRKLNRSNEELISQIDDVLLRRFDNLKLELDRTLVLTDPKERQKLVLNLGKRIEELQFLRGLIPGIIRGRKIKRRVAQKLGLPSSPSL